MVLSWVVVESNSETKSSVYLQLLVGYVSHALLFLESLKALKLLRVNAEDEELGLDSSHHGGDNVIILKQERGKTVS